MAKKLLDTIKFLLRLISCVSICLLVVMKKIKRSRIIILWRFTAKKRILKNLQGIC